MADLIERLIQKLTMRWRKKNKSNARETIQKTNIIVRCCDKKPAIYYVLGSDGKWYCTKKED